MKGLKKKLDNPYFGAVAGLIFPFLSFFVVYFLTLYPRTLTAFWNIVNSTADKQASTLTLMVISNLLAFYFIFFRARWEYASRGLVFMTLVLGAIVVYLKL
jgi:hypothetical protein